VTSSFDPIAAEYSDLVHAAVASGRQEHDFYTRRKADALVDLAWRHLGDPRTLRVLDVGCGIGLTDQHLVGRVGELHGVDTAPAAIRRAVERNPDVDYRVYAGDALPYPDGHFDVAFSICVIHHVPLSHWEMFTRELSRVLRPGGIAALVEHNPYNPFTRMVVSRCAFDEDVVLLGRRRATRVVEGAGLRAVERRYIIFLPIDRRWVARLERLLAWLPLGAQYYVAARRPL
jgi:SAM-dependent methyltransferase